LVGDEVLETLLIQVDVVSETMVVCREIYEEVLLEKMKVADSVEDVNVIICGLRDKIERGDVI